MESKKNKLTVILLVLAVSLCMVATAFAEGGKNQKRKSVVFTAAGLVTAIDTANLTMTLDIDKANRVLKNQIGSQFTFTISDQVKVKTEGTDPGVFDLTLDDIVAGEDYVRVLGKKVVDGTNVSYIIDHIVVYVED